MKRILVLGACALFISCNSSTEKTSNSDSTAIIATDTTEVITVADSTTSVSTVAAVSENKVLEVKVAEATAVKPVVKESQPPVAVVKAVENTDNSDIKKGELLISKSDCFACHKVQDKLLGPSYKEVANKYEKTKTNIDYLVNKVKTGGSGVWGAVPMSPHPALSDEDARAMILYVLSLK